MSPRLLNICNMDGVVREVYNRMQGRWVKMVGRDQIAGLLNQLVFADYRRSQLNSFSA